MSKWTTEDIELVEQFLGEGLTYQQIAEELWDAGCTPRTQKSIERLIWRRRQRAAREGGDKKYFANKTALAPQLESRFKRTLEDITALRDDYMRIVNEKFIKVGRPVNATKKILTLSDFHGPWFNRFVVDHALQNHSDADILVLNGDLFDNFCVSKWPKSKSVLLRWEYDIVIELMKLFVSVFPKVVLVAGNHENRLQSMFSARIDPAVSFLTSPDLLKRVSQGYDFDENDDFVPIHDWGGKVVYDSSTLKWYCKIGQAIFVHPSKGYSTVPLTNVRKAANYFDSREDYQCIVMAHTHQQGHTIHEGKLLFDQGCCCIPLEYEAKGDMMFGGQVFGYGLVFMDEGGNVDFDKSGPVYLGTGSPTKEDDLLDLL